MKNKLIHGLTLFIVLFITACQSVDNFLTDSGMRQHSEQDMVVKPVPRIQIPEVKNNDANFKSEKTSSIPSAPTPTKNDVNTVKPMPAKSNSQDMVPNVAPSFGE